MQNAMRMLIMCGIHMLALALYVKPYKMGYIL